MAEREMVKRRMGPFQIEGQLGVGGMGIVYLATYGKTGQKVALKVLTPALSSDEQLLKRFEREMAILKKLRHDHIVRYYGGGRAGSQHFYAMELMDGGALDEVIKEQGKVSWERTIDFAKQIAMALEFAHNSGIIHRDLKPANCFLAQSGRLKLGDFGIARDTQATALTAAGKTVGTYAYMAPEQISGKPPVSRKTDLYALGCVMYEMLTGAPPFEAETPAEMLFHHLKDDPPRVTSIAIDCPLPLEEVIDKLLEKDPEERFYDALALQVGLDEVGQKIRIQESIAKQTVSGGEKTSAATKHDRTMLQQLLGRKKKKKRKKQLPLYERGWFLVTALVMLVALLTFLLWPASEAELIAQAQQLIEEGDREFAQTGEIEKWRQARDKFIEPILADNPQSEFADEANAFLKKLGIEETHRRSVNRARISLEPESEAEGMYVRAWSFEKQGDRITALSRYRSMIRLLEGREQDEVFITLANRRIESIQSEAGEGESGTLVLIREALERADRFADSGALVRADTIWMSVIEVYGENREYQKQVEYARSRREGKEVTSPFVGSKDSSEQGGEERRETPRDDASESNVESPE